MFREHQIVRIDEDHVTSTRLSESVISGSPAFGIRLFDQAEVGEMAIFMTEYFRCVVGAAIVHDQYLKILESLLQDGIKRFRQKPIRL